MPAARTRDRADGAKAQPRSDAYVGLLGLSLLALIAAMLFAFLNWNLMAEKPKQVPMAAPARPATNPPPAAQPAAPGMNAPGAAAPAGAPPAAPQAGKQPQPNQPPGKK